MLFQAVMKCLSRLVEIKILVIKVKGPLLDQCGHEILDKFFLTVDKFYLLMCTAKN